VRHRGISRDDGYQDEGIDKVSPVPYYYQLEQLLQEKIERTPHSGLGCLPSKLFLLQTEQINKRLRNKAAVVTREGSGIRRNQKSSQGGDAAM